MLNNSQMDLTKQAYFVRLLCGSSVRWIGAEVWKDEVERRMLRFRTNGRYRNDDKR